MDKRCGTATRPAMTARSTRPGWKSGKGECVRCRKMMAAWRALLRRACCRSLRTHHEHAEFQAPGQREQHQVLVQDVYRGEEEPAEAPSNGARRMPSRDHVIAEPTKSASGRRPTSGGMMERFRTTESRQTDAMLLGSGRGAASASALAVGPWGQRTSWRWCRWTCTQSRQRQCR
jgi:hypothetical protein